ncbi:MAG: hypothetical protein HOG03_21430 [Desulfobacula sp.]|jgi:hypothetical protein|uniref:hypothetical protein n=1 Tax=Desulfobacula sp. TaxID=2593537 RepID=UPI001DEBEF8B|nr:hypothetical protein [Desulfobacteraceae bacterium]MBT3807135.1 hypothetical protein [Desulfobacula sp.]MBT5546115.1 hypothetical protein [Desulfobacula sp.]MBT5972686.1 hypothetical protein [Desulfobacula sp.]MBT6748285.1 hypothetical protein [Desulfobacula sp.]
MSLKDVLNAQKSGELDLMPGSAFNEVCPLTIRDSDIYIMFQGDEWYYAEINETLIQEALALNGIKENDIKINDNIIIRSENGQKLFEGETIQDLLGDIVSGAGISVEFG